MAGAGDALVRGGDVRPQPVDQVGPRVDDLRAELDESLVPQLERGELALGDPRAARRLQEAVALAQHAVVVGEHTREPR